MTIYSAIPERQLFVYVTSDIRWNTTSKYQSDESLNDTSHSEIIFTFTERITSKNAGRNCRRVRCDTEPLVDGWNHGCSELIRIWTKTRSIDRVRYSHSSPNGHESGDELIATDSTQLLRDGIAPINLLATANVSRRDIPTTPLDRLRRDPLDRPHTEFYIAVFSLCIVWPSHRRMLLNLVVSHRQRGEQTD